MKKLKPFIPSAFFLMFFGLSTTFSFGQFTNLFDLVGASNGSSPQGALISDGTFLYGITVVGGTNNKGVVFKIKSDGTGYTKLLDFDGTTNGSQPQGSLIFDGTFLYGMTVVGGINNEGVIYKIKPDGTGFVKLLDFTGAANGGLPYGSLLSDGTFLYGMTHEGGTNNEGVIFKIKPDGTGFVKLLDFAAASTGSNPGGSLISDGTFLYGMTYFGGANNDGTVFKIKPDGTGYVRLLDFAGATNGAWPFGSLISDGTFLYGMSTYGGPSNDGTIFKIKPDGTGYVKLFNFVGYISGANPYGSLVFDGSFLFGMTYESGANSQGTIFKIKPNGTGFVKLLDFAGATNGSYPFGSFIFDGTSLFGMTGSGGANDLGLIFKYQYYCTALTFTQSPNICSGESFIVGTHAYITNGTYIDSLISSTECDSIVTTNLTFNSVDTSVSHSSQTLTANAVSANYQWIDCNNGNTQIPGAIGKDFTPAISGNYAVMVTTNTCSGTSACNAISIAGIVNYAPSNLISPNEDGKNDVFIIQDLKGKISLEIFNVWGEKIFESENYKNDWGSSNVSNGLYYYYIKNEDGQKWKGWVQVIK